MSVYAGPADWWTDGTDAGRNHIATKGIVTSNRVLHLDAGVSSSYSGTGSTWNDLSGNSNHATLYNSPAWSTTFGGMFTFNGTNNYAQPPAGFANFTSGITVFSILNMGTGNGAGWERIIDFGNGADVNNIVFYRSGTTDSMSFYIAGGPNASATNIITNSAMANYAVTFDNSTTSFYKNGSLFSSSSTVGTIGNVTRNNCYIGRSNWAADAYFESTIGILIIYNRALTATEISQNFNALRGRFGL